MSLQRDMEEFIASLRKTGFFIEDMKDLAAALSDSGFSRNEIRKLLRFNFKDIRKLINGQLMLFAAEHVIDCDPLPAFLGKQVVEHRKAGLLKFNGDKLRLYQAEQQKNERTILGKYLYKELAGMPVLNSNVLDYLLAHQEIIPEEWIGKYIFFWGSIFFNPEDELDSEQSKEGHLFVRCLFQSRDGWCSKFFWFGTPLGTACYAVLSD
jgi:hypothetical protein